MNDRQLLEYATPGNTTAKAIEKGLSSGRMAFLLFLVGVLLFCNPYLCYPFLVTSFILAIISCIRSRGRSVFAWVVLVAVGHFVCMTAYLVMSDK